MTTLYIVLTLYDNRILSIEPFRSREDAETRAVQLSSEWYKKDGVTSFGKNKLETFDECKSIIIPMPIWIVGMISIFVLRVFLR